MDTLGAEMDEKIDFTIDSTCAAYALRVGVASTDRMQELNTTPQEHMAANAVKIRELEFKIRTLKFQNGDVQNLKLSVTDKLHKPLVAACNCSLKIKVVCSPKMCAQIAGKESLNEMSVGAPVLVRQTQFTEAFGAFGQAVTKPPGGLPVSPATNSEANMDVSVEDTGLVSVEEFGPTSADEDVVQEADELKHVPAPVFPSKAEVIPQFYHVPFRSWCAACVRGCGRGRSLGHRNVDMKRKEAEQIPNVCGKNRAHDTLPVLIV